MKKYILVAVSALLVGIGIGEFDGIRRMERTLDSLMAGRSFTDAAFKVGFCVDTLRSIDRNDIDDARGLLQRELGHSLSGLGNIARQEHSDSRYTRALLANVQHGRDYIAGHPPLATVDGIGSGTILIEDADFVLNKYGENAIDR